MTTVDASVAVVGNGPVGQSAALLLARWGVSVVLLDQRSRRDPVGSKSIVQQRDVLDIWEAVGAGRRIAAEGLTWTTARTFYRDQELFRLTFPSVDRFELPPFVNISQTRTEQILDECIAVEPLIHVRWDHRVADIQMDSTGVTLTCGSNRLRADYVVACAGGHGDDIRHRLGVSFDGATFDDRFLICDIRTELPGWANERRFYFDPPWNPGRQVLIHPCPDSTFRIDWQVPPDYDEPSEVDSGRRDARIRAITGDRPYEVVWSSVYRFQSRVVDRMRAGRVLLAGDLAHLYAPFGARGLNSGVQDAENAAWKLAFVLNGWAGDDLLDSYHDERHAAALENLDVTNTTMRFLVPQSDAEREHRLSTLESAALDPAARAAVDSGRLAEPYWYVDSPLTTPDATRPFAGRPPRGTVPAPGPGILIPDAPVTSEGVPHRLREIARDGFLLIAAEGVDAGTVLATAREATSAPVRLLRLADIDTTGVQALAAKPGELWIVRPDAHIAAILTSPRPVVVRDALRRALAST
jgi:pentachlorophenol monooxygenase/3-(3-hydroxy-phenyl)propionate hydroxylase